MYLIFGTHHFIDMTIKGKMSAQEKKPQLIVEFHSMMYYIFANMDDNTVITLSLFLY